jgi:hypothetical protein
MYGYPIAASLALTVVLSSTDRFVLDAYLGEAAVGAYHASYSIANRTLDLLFLWLGTAGQPALVMALERGGEGRRVRTAADLCWPAGGGGGRACGKAAVRGADRQKDGCGSVRRDRPVGPCWAHSLFRLPSPQRRPGCWSPWPFRWALNAS